ncbi:NAD(P)/FAD-dependent oxidoreductase [bacterium]|nr:NAD(P)/FAD-dependent oxidoreductase [bacterium]
MKQFTLPDEVEVLIVGAGPAGLTAANVLSAKGKQILLIDIRKQIGHPLRCGELTFQDIFPIMGFQNREKWVRWNLSDDSEDMVVLNRPVMENDMAREVAEKGVLVIQSTSVTAIGEFKDGKREITLQSNGKQQRLNARLTIIADGVSSATAQLARIETRLTLDEIASCMAYRITGAQLKYPYRFSFQHFMEIRPFYFWVIPSGKDEANVGICVHGSRGHAAAALLDQYIKKSSAIDGGTITDTIVGSFPSAPPLEKPYRDGIMVAGTAARLISADTGDGIIQAALSGRAAAEVYLSLAGEATTEVKLSIYRKKLNYIYQQLYESLDRRMSGER